MIHRYARTFLIVLSLTACGDEPPPPPAASEAPATVEGVTIGVDDRPLIVFLGTSLTAGLGLSDPSQAYPGLVQAKLDSAGLRYRVVNAGISGETSAGALRRVDWVMSQGEVAVLFVETGANDGLRGQDPDTLRANLDAIFARARTQNPAPLLILAGMEAPPNLGREYTSRFRAVYPEVASTHGATLLPFLLEGVAGVDSLNQADGIHPTAVGQQRIAEMVWAVVRGVIGSEQ